MSNAHTISEAAVKPYCLYICDMSIVFCFNIYMYYINDFEF